MMPTPHIIESALLLLVAFALGCAIGYGLRRIFPRVPQPALLSPVAVQQAPVPDVQASDLPAPIDPAIESDIPLIESPSKTKPPRSSAARTTGKAKRTPPILSSQPDEKIAETEVNKDDLKKISGIGPKLEATLNQDGVLSFTQIAAWKAKDIAEIDARLNLRGRIKRDGWIAQAKALSKAK